MIQAPIKGRLICIFYCLSKEVKTLHHNQLLWLFNVCLHVGCGLVGQFHGCILKPKFQILKNRQVSGLNNLDLFVEYFFLLFITRIKKKIINHINSLVCIHLPMYTLGKCCFILHELVLLYVFTIFSLSLGKQHNIIVPKYHHKVRFEMAAFLALIMRWQHTTSASVSCFFFLRIRTFSFFLLKLQCF